MEKKKRQQRTVGAVVKIPLENGFHCYARILEDDFAFYNVHTKEDLPINDIIGSSVLFFAAVYDDAVLEGHWQKIGKILPLEAHLNNKPPVYTQDRLNLDKYTIYKNGEEKPATREDCIGLEYLMFWEKEEIEERLNDHFAGRKNEFVEKMKQAEMYSNKAKA
jgi:hypothetical protein